MHFAPYFVQLVASCVSLAMRALKVHSSTTQHKPSCTSHTHTKETIMKTTTFNKDNVGATVLLAALLFTIGAALFSTSPAEAANATNVAKSATHVETIVVTATRLK
jgi:hypothetical protein